MSIVRITAVITAALFLAASAMAEVATPTKGEGLTLDLITSVPRTMAYQANLKDISGENAPPGDYNITFRIYDALAGGTLLWDETVTVTVSNKGIFSAVLGEIEPLNLSFDADYYLSLQVEGDDEMEPRQKLHMSPYAAAADTSEHALTLADNAVTSPTIQDGSMQFSDIGQNGATAGQVIKWDGSAWVADVDSSGADTDWIISGDDQYSGVSGNVGIGTTTPTQKLEVAGNIKVGADDTVFTSNLSSNSPLRFDAPAGTTRMYIDDVAGSVGIGTTNPSSNVHIASGANAFLRLESGSGLASSILGYNAASASASINFFPFDDGLDRGLQFYTNGDLANPNAKMVIMGNGNVGIGTTNPGVKLDVVGGGNPNTYIRSQINDDNDAGLHVRGNSVGSEPGGVEQWALFIRGTDNSGDFYINEDYNNGVIGPRTRMVIKNESGNVGIGTTTPNQKLGVQGMLGIYPQAFVTPTVRGLFLYHSGGGAQMYAYDYPGGDTDGDPLSISAEQFTFFTYLSGGLNARLKILNNGNVGIGTTSPLAHLHIQRPTSSTSEFLRIQPTDVSAIPKISIRHTDGTEVMSMSANTSGARVDGVGTAALYLGAGGFVRATIDTDGEVGIGTITPQGALDVSSTTGAFIVPRMTTTERDALTAVNGMIVYNTSDNQFNFYENGAWVTK